MATVKRGGRRVGAGRKPKGAITGKRAWLSTRITDDTRRRLEQAAEANAASLSQEIERRLRDSFSLQHGGDPYLRALAYVMGRIHLGIGGGDLRSDTFAFAAFRAAVVQLLDDLAPEGDIGPPKTERAQLLAEKIPSAEQVGALSASVALTSLKNTNFPSAEEAERYGIKTGSWPYGFARAREELGVQQNPASIGRGFIADMFENTMQVRLDIGEPRK